MSKILFCTHMCSLCLSMSVCLCLFVSICICLSVSLSVSVSSLLLNFHFESFNSEQHEHIARAIFATALKHLWHIYFCIHPLRQVRNIKFLMVVHACNIYIQETETGRLLCLLAV